MNTGHSGSKASRLPWWGTFSSSTMMVMMMAMTPSLKASSRVLPMEGSRRRSGAAHHVLVEIPGEILEVIVEHLAELVGEILHRAFLFELHVFRAASALRNDEGIEARGGVQGRG